MKVLFIVDIPVIGQEPLGLMHLAAILKQHGHTCETLDLSQERNMASAIRKSAPQLIAFSATTGHHRRLTRASREIQRSYDVPSIFGGPHPTYFPEMIEEDGVDIICLGEGEFPLLELVEALEADKDYTAIPNLWVKRNGKIYRNAPRPFLHDLDQLPWPDRDLFYPYSQLHTRNTHYFMGGRGCPYNCTFCFNHIGKKLSPGRYVRWRSVDNLIEELKTVKARYDMRFVNFQDDTFILKLKWLEEFAPRYRDEVGLPFLCHVRADLVTDHISRLLAESGCTHAVMGLETGNNDLRNMVLKKQITNEQLIQTCHSLKSYGITITTQNMFGLPFETIENVLETIELNIQCKPDHTNLYFYVPYPRTELAQIAVDEGLFRSEDLDSLPEIFTTEFSSVNLDLEEARQIEQLAKLTRFAVHFPIFYPLLRRLFKYAGANGLKRLISKGITTLEGIYMRTTWELNRLFRPNR